MTGRHLVADHHAGTTRAIAALEARRGAERIATEALNGDPILVDGDQGIVHLRPDDTISAAFRDKIARQAKALERCASTRELPAMTLCGTEVSLQMNAGLMADLPSLAGSGAEGVGLLRTELQFLIRNHYASLDPAMRGWMDEGGNYMPPIPLGDPVRALREDDAPVGRILVGEPGSELPRARRELDDAVRLGLREALHRRVDRDDGGAVDGRIGIAAFLGGVEHAAELGRGRDLHGCGGLAWTGAYR